ncbi:aldo/keto reductase [Actinopolymorpha alba]|uniref:aldo/keto reductase n=1 Tax=Actinopolymorpha alba TaxID=533267 RepID=UPI00036D06D7|nr:aldo/keto reductase [Actinopolymorpha alba]
MNAHALTAPRRLGRTQIEVSALGLGCWAIGGPFTMFGQPDGWGEVDDTESARAIRRALDLGITFFDTADAYGTGHSERVLGKALGSDRGRAVIATKFGYTYDENLRELIGEDPSPEYVRRACQASLTRLGTDYIDLYQLHIGELPEDAALTIRAVLEDMVADGLIRAYGWSTDNVGNAKLFATGEHCASIQHDLNIFSDAPEMLAACQEFDVASINRAPLAMGLLTGKFRADFQLPADDVRANAPSIQWFKDGKPNPELLAKLEAVREILRSDGRTLTQGALAWIWGRSERTIPIPGFKSVAQVEENAGALEFGPLKPAQLAEIHALLHNG